MQHNIYFSLLFLVFNIGLITAQPPTQTIRGTIINADNLQAVIGAAIVLEQTNFATTTDENGTYRLENIPVGRYQIRVSHIGYETLVIPEILLESGKEFIQDIRLAESLNELDEIVVQAPRERITHPVSTKTLTIEETRRFPATFYDPARLASAFAGVVSTSDQANGIAIRGNSPNGLSWRLEGIEIVNPNHTNNAGTASDRMTQNGGGVNILSAQMLGTSTFLTGAFPAGYGNVLSGVLDMKLRKGNDEQHEFIGQIGLIGLDLAAEGPLSKNSKASYLVNYRYSTIGLLSTLGVPLGDEEISFQDLAFHLSFPTQKAGTFTIFGMGGKSKNIFEAQRDTAVWEFQKDRFDISFNSEMGALGLSHLLPIGQKSILKTTLVGSAVNSTRDADRLDNNFELKIVDGEYQQQQKIGFSSIFSHKINLRHRLTVGLNANYQNNNIQVLEQGQDIVIGDAGGVLWQPFVNWEGQLSPKLNVKVGLHYTYFSFNQTQAVEPRLALSYQVSAKQNLSLAYGLHSQVQLPQVYFALSGASQHDQLELTKAHHIVLGYKNQLNTSTHLSVETYYQSLFDVPISLIDSNSFSALNLLEGTVDDWLTNEGTGKNYGLEISLQKYLTNGYYFLANATLYESKYTGSDGIERDTRYNGNYIANATIGKEWKWAKKERPSILGVNVRVVYLGGFRETPIDVQASKIENTTIYFENEAFSIQQAAYFKTDLRIYWKRSKITRSSTLALDIQNATNQQNIAFNYFDVEQGAIITKYQLGLIPILTYRLAF